MIKDLNEPLSNNEQTEMSNVFFFDEFQSAEDLELNHRVRNEFVSQCLSTLEEDDQTRREIEVNWRKTVRWLGDSSILSAFFDNLPGEVKKFSALKFQEEIRRFFNELFQSNASIVVSSVFQSDSFVNVVRRALKISSTSQNFGKTAVVYISSVFEPDLISDLRNSIGNIKFESVSSPGLFEDLIDVHRLEEAIQRDAAKENLYPALVIAAAGTTLLGHCDDLTKIKAICSKNNLYLHVTGDLLGSLPFTSAGEQNGEFSADSFTLDLTRLFAVQNLPNLTFFLRKNDEKSDQSRDELLDEPLYHWMLQNPSVGFVHVWSISQRCSNEEILRHLKKTFELMVSFSENLKALPEFRLVNEDQDPSNDPNYKHLYQRGTTKKNLPKTVLIFRFEPSGIDLNNEDVLKHVDILNLWLHDKIIDSHPTLNFNLLKSSHFHSPNKIEQNSTGIYGIRFAPLENFREIEETQTIDDFFETLKTNSKILQATMKGRNELSTVNSKFPNIQHVKLNLWAGLGAVRYIPDDISFDNAQPLDESTLYRIDSIQAELSRKLQHKDSAFSLGYDENEENPISFIRLGMIKNIEDLDILLKKISDSGKEVEQSLKYVEDMAEKIKTGIDKVQKDLESENLRVISEEGLLRSLPLVSSLVSWWSPADNTTPKMKGRSYDLNTDRVESTEEIYLHRMQIQKSATAETHSNHATPSLPPSNE